MTRVAFERVCRLVALACVALTLWSSLRASQAAPRVSRTRLLSLPDSVVADSGTRGVAMLKSAWLATVGPSHTTDAERHTADSLHLPLRSLPAVPLRAALGAMVASGAAVTWGDETQASGLALSVARSATPSAPLDVRVSANAGSALVLRDAGGVLDSVSQPASAMTWQLRTASGELAVRQGQSTATVPVPDSTARGRVLVVAQPGWEGKFVIAALEEAGWLVDGSMRVSPSGVVTVGAPQRLDISRYATVVVTDSMAVDAGALLAFVQRGGSLVLGGDALRIPSLATLRPARATVLRGAIAGALLTAQPRTGLEAWELDVPVGSVVLQTDASDHGHSEPALVARRFGKGRVVAMPYRESWRWRMQGTDDGMAEHRRWWQGALEAAVPDANTDGAAWRTTDALPGRSAPYADLVARVGAPSPTTAASLRAATGTVIDASPPVNNMAKLLSAPWLLGLTVLALLAEWASRRLRGER